MKNRNGFTLAELLIVVAIIAVLVGVSIPVFNSQLEKSREAKDLANVRAKYAEIMSLAVDESEPVSGSDILRSGSDGKYAYSAYVSLSQTKSGWDSKLPINIGGVEYNGTKTTNWLNDPEKDGKCLITYIEEDNEAIFDWGGTPVYLDSPEIQSAKLNTQNQAKDYLQQLDNLLASQSDRAAYKTYLDTLGSGARFTLAGGTVAHYKSSEDLITTMEKDGNKDESVSRWINFTLDEKGEIKIFNYVDENYSYSSFDALNESNAWIGTAVIK